MKNKKTKKFITALLVISTLLSLTGCQTVWFNKSTPTPVPTLTPTVTPTKAPTSTPTSTPSPIPTATNTPTPTPHEHEWAATETYEGNCKDPGYIKYECACGEFYTEDTGVTGHTPGEPIIEAATLDRPGKITVKCVVCGDTISETEIPKLEATATPIPTATNTPVPTATNTPKPTVTNTPKPTKTPTPSPTSAVIIFSNGKKGEVTKEGKFKNHCEKGVWYHGREAVYDGHTIGIDAEERRMYVTQETQDYFLEKSTTVDDLKNALSLLGFNFKKQTDFKYSSRDGLFYIHYHFYNPGMPEEWKKYAEGFDSAILQTIENHKNDSGYSMYFFYRSEAEYLADPVGNCVGKEVYSGTVDGKAAAIIHTLDDAVAIGIARRYSY